MVLCNSNDITQSPTTQNMQSWYCFESNTTECNNVHIVPWKDFMSVEKQSSVVVRPFQYDSNKMPNAEFLKAVVNKYLNRPYETNTSELVLSAFRANTSENVKSLFCSELAALVLQDLGLLSSSTLADNYVPADFSMERPKSLKLIGTTLGKEIPVQCVSEGFLGTALNGFNGFTRFIAKRLGFIS